MLVNPLFAKDEEDNHKHHAAKPAGHALPSRKGKTLQPISQDLKLPPHARPIVPSHHSYQPVVSADQPQKTTDEAAVELIRRKVAALYSDEPDVKEELQQAVTPVAPLSKHRQFMSQLSASGKPLAQIQTEWHNYYASLPNDEKHAVWREFYQANGQSKVAVPQTHAAPTAKTEEFGATTTQHAIPKMPGSQASTPEAKEPKHTPVVRDHIPNPNYQAKHDRRSRKQVKKQLLDKVNLSANTQAKAKQHVQSLAFGLGTGFIVLVIFLFGFFNEMFIAPFIQPSRHVSATPIIVSSDTIAAGETPEVIVPKINVQIPLVYDEKSVVEADVQRALERGVIHYPTTSLPGQEGNAAFFGHSSNNIFNKGKYKFAFVLLHELVPGDIFYLTRDKTVYSYRVFDKRIVPPTEMSVLDPIPGKPATATLITCDPPGTSTNRLVVWGEQISPNPAGAAPAQTPAPDAEADTSLTELPSEGPTMWKRFWSWLF